MAMLRNLLSAIVALACTQALAELPSVESPLPLLDISDRGELVFEGDDFGFTPWRSDIHPGKVHILQYFGATMEASETFQPFTDLLQDNLEPGSYHVTTIVNLDAALWGTSGFVVSELEKNKRKHPRATLVVDEEGSGVQRWSLGEDGAGLVVVDHEGKVKYFTTDAMDSAEMQSALDLVKSSTDS